MVNKSSLVLIVGVFIVVLIVGMFFIITNNSTSTLTKYPKSKITLCFEDAKEEMKRWENEMNECIQQNLIRQGYTDGIDCIQNSETSVCSSINRYNAEVDASNDCIDLVAPESPNIFDCAELTK